MRHDDVVSQYKNLWMRWTYLRKQGTCRCSTPRPPPSAATLSSGWAASMRVTPHRTSRTRRSARSSTGSGVRIRIHPELEVEHVKSYSLSGLLRVDYMRAVSLTLLKLRHPDDLGDNNTSVPMSYMASVPLAGLAVLAIGLGLLAGWGWATAIGVAGGARGRRAQCRLSGCDPPAATAGAVRWCRCRCSGSSCSSWASERRSACSRSPWGDATSFDHHQGDVTQWVTSIT